MRCNFALFLHELQPLPAGFGTLTIMSNLVHIQSTKQFSDLLTSSYIVVVDFYADWCGPCKAIAPVYEQLSSQLSRPNRITFTKVDTDAQQELARAYGVTAMPTFMIFKNQRRIDTIKGADNKRLSEAVRKLAIEAESSSTANGTGEGGASGSTWLGASLPKGYRDITDQVDVRGLDLLNLDTDFGTARSLFDASKPRGKVLEGDAYCEIILTKEQQMTNLTTCSATQMSS